ncbi:MAG: twin-arginine translocation signal domain-containing protein [bacterium]|nr:twin-arginine translocation signal domain-containing protein [bacterium]
MKRRDFIKTSSIAGLTAACAVHAAEPSVKLARRSYGDTGIELSIIGFGGIVVKDAEQDHANETVAKAVERGVNYFDVAPSYGDAELKLGPALEPFRKDVFLACKTGQRKAEGARRELDQSLTRLRTDHLDLYQLHAITTMDDVNTVFADDGAMKVFIKAREEGVLKHLGFSAHSPVAAIEALNRFDFDSVLFPFNFVTWNEGDFGPQVMQKAKEKGAARLALKALAKTKWADGANREPYEKCWYQPVTDDAETELAARFTLSLDITAAIPPGEEELFWKALAIAENFKPLSSDEQNAIQRLARGVEPIFTART